MSGNLQEEKDKLQAIGEEFVREILDNEFQVQTAESIEKLQKFYDEWILAQKTLLNEYATRAESSESSCENAMKEIQQITKQISDISEDLKTALESATAASTQSVNSAKASQEASETALASAQTAENALENINITLAQFETAYQTIMENIEHLHEDAQIVTTALNKANEILPIIEEFIKLSPNIEEMKSMIENITAEILPDLRRMQQSLIDQLTDSQEIYEDLRLNILPRAEEILPLLVDLVPRGEALNLAEFQENIEKVEQAIIDLNLLKEQVIKSNNDLELLLNTGQDLINEIFNKRNESIEAIHQKEIDSLKLIKDTDTLIKQGLINTAEDLTEKSVITIKAQQTTSSNKFAEFVTDKITAFTNFVAEKTAEFLNLPYPIKYQYTQHPNKTTGLFDETETPQALFGGDWELVSTELKNNVPTEEPNEFGVMELFPNRKATFVSTVEGFPHHTRVTFPVPFIGKPFMTPTASYDGDGSTMYNMTVVPEVQTGFYQITNTSAFASSINTGDPSQRVIGIATGYWKNPTDPISADEEKWYVKIWKRINPPTEV